MNTTEIYLIAMIIIFALPYLVWRLGRTDDWAPLVVVQIISGILLGPGVLGAAFPEHYRFVFNPQVVAALNGVAWWAVMLFVWIAGIELDLGEAWKRRGESGLTAALALAAPFTLGCGAALLLPSAGWQGAAGERWQFVLGIGMSCAVTALPILILLIEKLQILRYASLDDIAIWGVLALILLDWQRAGRQLAFVALFALAAAAVRWALPRLPERDRWYIAVVWLAAVAFGADGSGLHFMVGAFLAGAVLDGHWFDQRAMDTLIFANVLLDKQIISADTFTALLVMAVASTMLTVPAVAPLLKKMQRVQPGA